MALVTLTDYKVPARPSELPECVPDAHLVEAVGAWLQGEPAEHVAALLQLPVRSLPRVTMSIAWTTIAMQWRDELRKQEAATLTRLVGVAVHKAARRLEKGDVVIGKNGQQFIKPVSAKDAAQIAAIFMDRRRDLYKDIDGVPDAASPEEIEHIIKVAQALNKKYDVTPKKPALEGHVLEIEETDDEHEQAQGESAE
jgi:hypothetical protein